MSRSEAKSRLHNCKSVLKSLLCVVLVVSLCPPFVSAFADDSTGGLTGTSAPVLRAEQESPRADPGIQETVDTDALGIVMNLFNYTATDKLTNRYFRDDTDGHEPTEPGYNPSHGEGVDSDINEDKGAIFDLKFYATGDGEKTYENQYLRQPVVNPGNTLNEFTGVGVYTNNVSFYTLQIANQGIVKDDLSPTGYPLVNTTDVGRSTEYLFNPGEARAANMGTSVYENVRNLFKKVNDGTNDEMIVYDSNKNYAYYDINQGNGGEFTVYDRTYDRADGSKSGLKVGFFPFNDYNKEVDPCINPNEQSWVEGAVDHHLGMTMTMPIVMPYEGKLRNPENINESVPMTFTFSGDDDMWVFIDGKLVLDIGGIHQPVSGEINFETGVVQISKGTEKGAVYVDNNKNEYPIAQKSYSYLASGINETPAQYGDYVYMWDVYGFEQSNGVNDPAKPILAPDESHTTKVIAGILGSKYEAKNRAGSAHVLKSFYLERGGCDSNLMISTNIHRTAPHTATVKKTWDSEFPATKKENVRVQLIRKATDYDTGAVVGYAIVDEKELSLTSDWSASWPELAIEGYNPTDAYYSNKLDYKNTGDPSDNRYCLYTYLVREVPMEGFVASYSYDNDEEEIIITPEKVGDLKQRIIRIINTSESNIVLGDNLKLIRYYRLSDSEDWTLDSTYSHNITLDNYGSWEFAVDDCPNKEKVGDDIKNYQYRISYSGTQEAILSDEASSWDTQASIVFSNNIKLKYKYITDSIGGADLNQPRDSAAVPADFPTITVKNSPIYIQVKKEWEDIDTSLNHDNDSVWVQLYKQTYNEETGIWSGVEPVGDCVKLDKNTNNWEHKFPVEGGDNVRYFVREGVNNGGFEEAKTFIASNKNKLYVHDYTSYTRTGVLTNYRNNVDVPAQVNDRTYNLSYVWEKGGNIDADDPLWVTRTFDGMTELKQYGGDKFQTFDADTIPVKLTIPVAAEGIPDLMGMDPSDVEKYNCLATISLGTIDLNREVIEGENDPVWNVTSSGIPDSVEFDHIDIISDDSSGTVTVKIDAEYAKENAGKTFTILIPVKPLEFGANTRVENNVSITQTEYIRKEAEETNSGANPPELPEDIEVSSEYLGGEYVTIPSGYTSANATIANKPILTKLTVEKDWVNTTPGNDNIYIQLYDKDKNIVKIPKATGTGTTDYIMLSSSNNWSYTLDKLDLVTGEQYTAKEGVLKPKEGDASTLEFVPFDNQYAIDGNPATQWVQSAVYFNADGSQRLIDTNNKVYLDGGVGPDAGKIVIRNAPLYLLPASGGIGVLGFLFIGAFTMALTAGVLLIRRNNSTGMAKATAPKDSRR